MQALNISESGRRAFHVGLEAKDNPFVIGSPNRSLWAKGWLAGSKEPKGQKRDIEQAKGDRDQARRACAATRAVYKSVLIEIENEINQPRVSPSGKQRRLDTILSIINKARKRVDL